MVRRFLWCVPVLAVCLGGCLWLPALAFLRQPMVNIQITEYKDSAAFERMIAELRRRGITATILVNDTFAAAHCDLLRQLDAEGYEIMAFARPTGPDGSSTTMSQLTYDDQHAFISQIKAGIEACLGRAVTGFRCTRFDQNQDTYRALQTLGFEYNLGFVAGTDANLPEHDNAILPYRADPYGFWALPMHSAPREGQLSAFCDNPFRDVPADQWEALLQDELDRMALQGRPLLVEFHPYFSGADEDRFQAFVRFLDYLVLRNGRSISVAEYVEWSQTAAVASGMAGGSAGCGCEE